MAYQGDISEDGDGYIPDPDNPGMFKPEGAVAGIASGGSSYGCDCKAAPCVGIVCPATGTPDGGVGGIVFQEILQDTRKTWLEVPVTPVITKSMGTTAPHELGHQFGLRGDQIDPSNPTGNPTGVFRSSNTYKIMDYVKYSTETVDYSLHPEHINLLRRRIKSPGK